MQLERSRVVGSDAFSHILCSVCFPSACRFLPVSVEIKEAYVSRVRELATSAGWVAAVPPVSCWSEHAFHSWSEREPEQSMEETEKQQALTQPMHLNFTWNGQTPVSGSSSSGAVGGSSSK